MVVIIEPNCNICGCEMNVPNQPETLDCGGDCLKCMAEAGDPEAVRTMIKLHADAIVKLTELISC